MWQAIARSKNKILKNKNNNPELNQITSFVFVFFPSKVKEDKIDKGTLINSVKN